MMSRAPVWVAALWWASLTTIGFLVVPLLFVHLPTPALAGSMAARLFSAQTWVSTLCGLFLLLQQGAGRSRATEPGARTVTVFVLAGMLLALLSEFAVAPRIVAREDLRFWHGVGSVLYVLQCLSAATVVWRLTVPRQANQV